MGELAKTGDRGGLIETMAAEYNLKPDDFWNTIRDVCGCSNASKADFITMLSVARDMKLSPLKKEIWLIQMGGKPTISIAADGYLQMLARQPDNAGVEYEEGWFPDVRKKPNAQGEHPLSRGGKVTLHRHSWRKPYVHIEWWDEVERNSPLWKSKGSRMLRHRAMSQAIRNTYGTYLPDEDEIRWAEDHRDDEPRAIPADISPVVKIQSLTEAGASDGSGALPEAADEGAVYAVTEPSPPAPDDDDDADLPPDRIGSLERQEGLPW